MIYNIKYGTINPNQSNDYYQILRDFSFDADFNTSENILYIPNGQYIIKFPQNNANETIEIKSKIIFEPGAVWILRSSGFENHAPLGFSSFSRKSLLLDQRFEDRFIKNVLLISGPIQAAKSQIFDIEIHPVFMRTYQNTTRETDIIYQSENQESTNETLRLRSPRPPAFEMPSDTISYHTSPAIVRFNKNNENKILYPEWWGAGVQKNKYFYRWIYEPPRRIYEPPRWIARNNTPDTQAIQACLLGAYPPLTDGAERQIIKFEGSYEVTQVDLVPGLHYEGFGSVLSKPSRRLAAELSEDASEDEIELLLMDLVAAYTRHINASRLFNTKELRTSRRQGSLPLHYKSTNEDGTEVAAPDPTMAEIFPAVDLMNENSLFSLYSFVLMDRGLTRLEALRVIATAFYNSYNAHVRHRDRHYSQILDESELLNENDLQNIQNNQLISFLNEALQKLTMHQQDENLHRAKDLFNLPGLMPRESDAIFSTDYYVPYLWVPDQERVDAITISNFYFDGNSEQQGEIQFFELEESCCIKLNCNPLPRGAVIRNGTAVRPSTVLDLLPFNFIDSSHQIQDPIRLKVDIKNCIFSSSPGDGIQCVQNITGTWSNNKIINCFRSGIAWVGGGNKINIENLKSDGDRYKTGIDIEPNNAEIIDVEENNHQLPLIFDRAQLGATQSGSTYIFKYNIKNELFFKNIWIQYNLQIQSKALNINFLKYVSWISRNRALDENFDPSRFTASDLENSNIGEYQNKFQFENLLLRQGPWLLSAPDSHCLFMNCILSISEYNSTFNATSRSNGLNTVQAKRVEFNNCQFEVKPQFLLESLIRDEEVAPLELGLVRATSSGSNSFPDKAIHEYFALGLSATDFNAEIVLRGCKFLVQDIEKIRQRYEEDTQEKKIRFSIPEPIEKKLNLKSIVGAVGLVESQHQLNLQMEGCYISEDYTVGFWIANAQVGKIDVSNSVIEAAIGVLSYDQNSAASNLFLTTTLKNTSFHKTKYNFVLFEIHQKQYVIQSLITQAEHAALLTTNENRSLVNEIHEEENLWGRFIFGHHSPRDYATLVHAIEGDTYRLINPQLSSRNPNIVEWVYRNGEWVPQVALPYQRRR